MTPTKLYRHFDAESRLLYVGISLRAITRLQEHMDGSAWASKIARVEIETFPSRADAMAAEVAAIRDEDPEFNLASRPRSSPRPRCAPGRKLGRPPLSADSPSVRICMRVTPEQRAAIDELGGAAWIREQIDIAEEPAGRNGCAG